jgi:endogenous inhibitor of DNA gyrase (YacG/DUF329 family)
MLSVPCPRCGKQIDADESKPLPPSFPFCSERCRLIDLGKWFDEEYRVPGKPALPQTPPPDEE